MMDRRTFMALGAGLTFTPKGEILDALTKLPVSQLEKPVPSFRSSCSTWTGYSSGYIYVSGYMTYLPPMFYSSSQLSVSK